MRALVYHGPEDIRCENVADPTPEDEHGIVLRVEHTAICGSDLHLYHGHLPSPPGFTVGHEFVGEVVETGSGVRDFRTGDRVLVAGVIGCGECGPCRKGSVIRCERTGSRVFGTSPLLDGGQAEAVAVPRADHALRRIPDGVSAEQAVLLTDILPTGYFGARNAEIQAGQDVAIVGAGPVGLMALMSAQLFGPARIFVLDSVPERLARAEELGGIPCDINQNAEARVREATDGRGVHAVIEAVGADEAVQTALRLARAGGVVSMVGVNISTDFPFPLGSAMMRNLTFRVGICPVPELWEPLVPLVQTGRLRPESVFTHHLPLSDGAKAYELFASRRDGVMKVLLDPAS